MKYLSTSPHSKKVKAESCRLNHLQWTPDEPRTEELEAKLLTIKYWAIDPIITVLTSLTTPNENSQIATKVKNKTTSEPNNQVHPKIEPNFHQFNTPLKEAPMINNSKTSQ